MGPGQKKASARAELVLRRVAVDERSSYDALKALDRLRTNEELSATGPRHTPTTRHWRDAGRLTEPRRW